MQAIENEVGDKGVVSTTVELLLQPVALCCSLLGVGGVLPAVCNVLQLFLVDSAAASLASSLVGFFEPAFYTWLNR